MKTSPQSFTYVWTSECVRDDFAVLYVSIHCVFLCKNVHKNNRIHLGPFAFDRLTDRPMIQPIAIPTRKKKCLAQCFRESRVLPQKNFWTNPE